MKYRFGLYNGETQLEEDMFDGPDPEYAKFYLLARSGWKRELPKGADFKVHLMEVLDDFETPVTPVMNKPKPAPASGGSDERYYMRTED